jgi:arylsulfatase A-like enzyme
MIFRSLLLFLVLLSVGCSESPPNVIVFLTDDQGWGDVSLHGNPVLETPRLDALARSGAQLRRFYVSPVCAPTRASFLTGKFHARTGVHGVTRGQENMSLEETTLAALFKKAGYRTGIFGKWHNGAHFPYHPNGRGFDQFVGFCGGHWSHYFDANLEENGKPIKSEGYLVDYLTDRALEFVENAGGQPFLCYIPYNTPHSPYQVGDLYFDKYKARGLDDLEACLLGMCENIDDNVGRVLDRLEELELLEDTIIVFFSDNGPNTFRYNEGLKGKKGSVDEGGMRVPTFISWKGKIPPNVKLSEVTAHIDLLPTLLDLIGRKDLIPEDVDGISLKAMLLGQDYKWEDRTLYMNWGRQSRIWNSRYALTNGNLYDLIKDPRQQNPLDEIFPGLKQELEGELQAWLTTHVPENETAFAIPVGFPGYPTSELPAHESHLFPEFPFGAERFDSGISYVTRWGWANDWVTNWTSSDAHVSWDIDVKTAGQYAISLFYTCADADVGSRLELSAGKERVECVVETAFDPPLYPDRDRYPRKTEVHEKDWATLEAGPLNLDSGKTRITLRALEIPGSQVMDLRAIQLKLLK